MLLGIKGGFTMSWIIGLSFYLFPRPEEEEGLCKKLPISRYGSVMGSGGNVIT